MLVLSTLVCSCVGGGSWGQPSWSITATGSGHCLPEPPQGYQGPLTCDQEKVRYRQTDGQTDRQTDDLMHRQTSTNHWLRQIDTHAYTFIYFNFILFLQCYWTTWAYSQTSSAQQHRSTPSLQHYHACCWLEHTLWWPQYQCRHEPHCV